MSLLQKEIELAASTESIERETLQRFGANARAEYIAEFPIDDINAPDEDNHRFAAGRTYGGITLKGDLRNISGMAEEIRTFRGIQTPLVAVRRKGGDVWLKQGFRRLNGAKLIIATEPGSPLAMKLKQGIPLMIYSGLTAEQERTLINDQTSKPFSKAEVWNIFREEIEGGRAWLNVAERMYRQIGQVTGSLDKVRNIDAIQKPDERQKELKKWLMSFAYQGWYRGLQSGPLIRNYWLQTYIWQDKFEGATRPDVVMDTGRQKALSTAIDEDQMKGEWNAVQGKGPRCDALLQKYATEDGKKYNPDGTRKKPEPDTNTEKIRSLKELQDLITQEEPEKKPTLLSRVYRISLKEGGDAEATRLIRNFDKCRAVYLEHREYLPEALRSTLGLILDGVDGSENTLMRLCMDNMPKVEEPGVRVVLGYKLETPVSVDTTPVVEAPVQPVVEAPVQPVVEAPVEAPVVPVEIVTGPSEGAGDVFNLDTETTSATVDEHQKAHDGPKGRHGKGNKARK